MIFLGKSWTLEFFNGTVYATNASSAVTYKTTDGRKITNSRGIDVSSKFLPHSKIRVIPQYVRTKMRAFLKYKNGKNPLKSARAIARRMKIYGGKKLRKHGSKIVRKNCSCGKKRR